MLATWLDPRRNEADANRRIIVLSAKVDSLALELNRKDKFILSLKSVIEGDAKSDEISVATPKPDRRISKKVTQLADTNTIDSTHSKN